MTKLRNNRTKGFVVPKTKPGKTIPPRSGEPGETAIVYVSSFPPRQCGIATFAKNLTHNMDKMLAPTVTSQIAAMHPGKVISYRYPRQVTFQINQDEPEEYTATAQRINQMDEVSLVSIQHEFGLFGGEWGANLIPFVQSLKKPMMITFHSVLPGPDEKLHNTVRALAERASAIIVMTMLSKRILSQQYAIPSRKIKVIPHGIHPQPYTSSRPAKVALGYSDRMVLSTFGLLSSCLLYTSPSPRD